MAVIVVIVVIILIIMFILSFIGIGENALLPLSIGIFVFIIIIYFIVQVYNRNNYEEKNKKELEEKGYKLDNIIFSKYSLTIYKDKSRLLYSYYGELPNGFSRTGIVSGVTRNSSFKMHVITDYSSLCDFENNLKFAALSEIFGIGVIIDITNQNDNYIKFICISIDNRILIPVYHGMIKFKSENIKELNNLEIEINNLGIKYSESRRRKNKKLDDA